MASQEEKALPQLPLEKKEKVVVVNAVPHDENPQNGPQQPNPKRKSRKHEHTQGESCCHHESDVSDDEEDAEPGLIDPMNEYDPEIDYIDLTNDRLQDIGDISKCTKLEEIVLRQNKLDNTIFNKLLPCTNLQRIDLYENRLTPIPRGELVFKGLDKLEELDLSFNELRFSRGIAPLPSLTHLYLIQNKLLDIHPDINNISSSITMLELGSNRLRKIENLGPCFAPLKQLFVGRNKIATIDPDSFKYLTNLQLLSLQSNRLRVLSNLHWCGNSLQEIYMSHNGLTTMSSLHQPFLPINPKKQLLQETMSDSTATDESNPKEVTTVVVSPPIVPIVPTGLECCLNLRVLDLSNNFLTTAGIDTAVLQKMTYLEELWLNDNLIENLDWLFALQGLKSLKTLYLERNPCSRDTSISNPQGRAKWVTKVKEILPQLEQIDADYL